MGSPSTRERLVFGKTESQPKPEPVLRSAIKLKYLIISRPRRALETVSTLEYLLFLPHGADVELFWQSSTPENHGVEETARVGGKAP